MEHVLLEELAEVWEECSQPDWDAYNALPVSRDSLATCATAALGVAAGYETAFDRCDPQRPYLA